MQIPEEQDVHAAFDAFPVSHRDQALRLRELVLDVAHTLDVTGGIEETLKWGQPSYLPRKPRIGSTVRVGVYDERTVALYFNCQTMLVERFRSTFGDVLTYSKNRAVLFDVSTPLPDNEIRQCVRMALRYHLDKLART